VQGPFPSAAAQKCWGLIKFSYGILQAALEIILTVACCRVSDKGPSRTKINTVRREPIELMQCRNVNNATKNLFSSRASFFTLNITKDTTFKIINYVLIPDVKYPHPRTAPSRPMN
jgi:hypothetical protein